MNTLPRQMTLEVYSYLLSPTFYHLHSGKKYNNKEKWKEKRTKKFQDCLLYVHQAIHIRLMSVRQVLHNFKKCLLDVGK